MLPTALCSGLLIVCSGFLIDLGGHIVQCFGQLFVALPAVHQVVSDGPRQAAASEPGGQRQSPGDTTARRVRAQGLQRRRRLAVSRGVLCVEMFGTCHPQCAPPPILTLDLPIAMMQQLQARGWVSHQTMSRVCASSGRRFGQIGLVHVYGAKGEIRKSGADLHRISDR